MDIQAIKPGDRITFNPVCRWQTGKATRIVHAVRGDQVFVTYNGWIKCFGVLPNEIIEHHPKVPS